MNPYLHLSGTTKAIEMTDSLHLCPEVQADANILFMRKEKNQKPNNQI